MKVPTGNRWLLAPSLVNSHCFREVLGQNLKSVKNTEVRRHQFLFLLTWNCLVHRRTTLLVVKVCDTGQPETSLIFSCAQLNLLCRKFETLLRYNPITHSGELLKQSPLMKLFLSYPLFTTFTRSLQLMEDAHHGMAQTLITEGSEPLPTLYLLSVLVAAGAHSRFSQDVMQQM